MKNLKVRKAMSVLAMVSLTLVTVSELAPAPIYHTSYSINQSYEQSDKTPVPYASYQKKDIYIGKEKHLKKLDPEIRKKSILIVDERTRDDPNMKIINSHKIRSKKEMASIAEVMHEYNEDYPSDWERSTESIINEWEVHNICSDMSFMPSHTDDVDLNNADEPIYRSKILSKVLR